MNFLSDSFNILLLVIKFLIAINFIMIMNSQFLNSFSWNFSWLYFLFNWFTSLYLIWNVLLFWRWQFIDNFSFDFFLFSLSLLSKSFAYQIPLIVNIFRRLILYLSISSHTFSIVLSQGFLNLLKLFIWRIAYWEKYSFFVTFLLWRMALSNWKPSSSIKLK